MPTFNEQMVTKLEAALLANPTAETITIGTETTTYVDVVARLEQFRRRVAAESGSRPMFSAVELGGFKP